MKAMKSEEYKIFGIGLSKTGTSSLTQALNDLGISAIHFPSDYITYAELAEGNYRLSILETYRAATDISISPFFAQLDRTYPNSKFILTLRDLNSWLDSACEHWEFMWQWAPHERNFRKFLEFITAAVYGVHKFNRDRFSFVYDQHQKSVLNYFVNRPNDLLVIDICAGNGWEKLCPFLNLPIPSTLFPFANRREEKIDRSQWIVTLQLATRDFQSAIPENQRFILIDEERLAGSALDDPLRARRPLERDGLSWGPPTDSTEAIVEIEKLRESGCHYLVIAWPAFWWLNHYAEFGAYLNDRFATLLSNERLLIKDLHKTKSEPT